MNNKLEEIEVVKEPQTQDEWFQEKVEVLEHKLTGNRYEEDKYKQSITTHKTLIEVVDENRERFTNPDDMIRQFEGIIAGFEINLERIEIDTQKTVELIEAIEARNEVTAIDVLKILLG